MKHLQKNDYWTYQLNKATTIEEVIALNEEYMDELYWEATDPEYCDPHKPSTKAEYWDAYDDIEADCYEQCVLEREWYDWYAHDWLDHFQSQAMDCTSLEEELDLYWEILEN